MGFDPDTRRELKLERRKVRALQTQVSELLAMHEYLKVKDEILQMKNAILKICLEGVKQQLAEREELKQEMMREIARIKAQIQQRQSQGSGHQRN